MRTQWQACPARSEGSAFITPFLMDTTPTSPGAPSPKRPAHLQAVRFLDFLAKQGVYPTLDSEKVDFDFLQHDDLPDLWAATIAFMEEETSEETSNTNAQ